MQRVAVVDYGGSNLRSVARALEHVAPRDCTIVVTDDAAVLAAADRVVFPGQGAIGHCMQRLRERGLVEVLRECVATRPFLGICLGLQTLLERSEEDGGTAGLGVYPGTVLRFPIDPGCAPDGSPYKVPHMGWNEVRWRRPHPVVDGIESGTRFYFVHSYYVAQREGDIVIGETDYVTRFASAVAAGSAFATQFHPEKSAEAGLRLLRNFLRWDGRP